MEIHPQKLEALLRREAPEDGPGACLAVMHQGKPAFSMARGLAALENPSPLSTQSIFNTGSLAKQFTAYAVFALQQQRRLNLDDEVRKHIPELPGYGKPLRIRHLLWHTSGIKCFTTLLFWSWGQGPDGASRRQALELVCRQKELNFAPGTQYLYGNSNYLLLSEIISRASRRSLSDFAQERLFGPLGMKATHFREDPELPIPGLVSGHWRGRDGNLRVSRDLGTVPGVGRLMSSLSDLSLWERFFSDTRKSDIPLLRSMLSQGWLENGQKVRYAGGLMLQNYRGLATVRHDGWSCGMRSEFCRFPSEGLAFIALSNNTAINPTWLARQAADIVLGRRLEPVSALGPGQPPAPPARAKLSLKRLRELSGLFREEGEGSFMELEPGQGGLMVASSPEHTLFKPESPTGFQGQGASNIYRMDFEEGGFILTKQGRARRFSRLKPLGREADEKLERFAGRYACPETVSRIDFKVKEGRLWLVSAQGERHALRHLKGGHFNLDDIAYHFTAKGMVMSSPEAWVRRLKWVRV